MLAFVCVCIYILYAISFSVSVVEEEVTCDLGV